MIGIRRFRLEDLDRVEEIEKQSFKKIYPRFLLIHLYTNFPDGFIVAEIDGHIVGYIIGTIEWGNGHIISIAVDRKFRNRGIGSILIEYLEKYFFERCNVKYIVLEVRVSNKKARMFYYKRGYVDKRFLPKYYDDGEDAILMVKKRKDLKTNYPITISMW
ncbi:ribosomal protein S18-alanine N-acetyltransferase [Methanotorris formicicus]|nr:ribosomal protein S18-alanine N-acetyltransferase [Methanotorris formicicus]